MTEQPTKQQKCIQLSRTNFTCSEGYERVFDNIQNLRENEINISLIHLYKLTLNLNQNHNQLFFIKNNNYYVFHIT